MGERMKVVASEDLTLDAGLWEETDGAPMLPAPRILCLPNWSDTGWEARFPIAGGATYWAYSRCRGTV
jgi:hypothetical protein